MIVMNIVEVRPKNGMERIPSMSLYLTGVSTLSRELVALGFCTTDGEPHGETLLENPGRNEFSMLLHGDLNHKIGVEITKINKSNI